MSARYRAVVFDLWNTLVPWPVEAAAAQRERSAARLGIPLERFDERWYDKAAYLRRESGPLAPAVRQLFLELGVDGSVDEFITARREVTRGALVATGDVLDALTALRRRGLRLALISNCTEDVAEVWPATALAASFDGAVFSATAGFVKPEARIYEIACEAVDVQPPECLFVGDGANDELRGAADVGMEAVLLCNGDAPLWPEVAGWTGPRIASVADVLGLVG